MAPLYVQRPSTACHPEPQRRISRSRRTRDPSLRLRMTKAILHIGLALLGALLLFGGARSAMAATPCAGIVMTAPAAIAHTQAISDTLQPASSMFVCRVDGAGTPGAGAGTGTRSVTTAGFVLLVLARWLHFV